MIVRKIYTAKENACKRLFLFFAGWGMDERPFREFFPTDGDGMICYDYRSLAFDPALLASYQEIRVVAWSMGVWAATQVLSAHDWPVTASLAVNGTPWPVDEEKGIAPIIFQGTLDGLNENTLQKFRRRMCGSREVLDRFMEQAPLRTIDDLREELQRIGELSRTNTAASFTWDQAVIGAQDKIFLPENQRRAWEGTDIRIVECAHYPADYWNELFNGR